MKGPGNDRGKGPIESNRQRSGTPHDAPAWPGTTDATAPGAAASIAVETLGQIMTACTVIIDPEASLEQAGRSLEDYGFRHLPVVRSNRVIGMLSERDLRRATALQSVRALLGRRPAAQAGPVSEIMRTPVHCLPAGETPARAAHDMVRFQIGAIPVVDGDVLLGLVTETDLLRVFLARCRDHRGKDDLARFHMREPMPCVSPGTSLEDAAEALDRRVGHLGVVCANELVGIVSERDLDPPRTALREAEALGGSDLETLFRRVDEVMETRVITAEPGFLLSRCAARMLDHRIASLPMVEDGQVAGILLQRDLLEYFASTSAR